jgi:predicted transposase/invertase (TIGR01784 family)
MGTQNPHDSLFRAVFSRPHLAADQLRAVLPPALLEQLDLDQLRATDTSFIAQSLGTYEADLLFELPWAGRSAYVYVLHEHQASVDAFMAQRLLTYMGLIWAQYRKAYRDTKSLPPIVPVVIYQGRQPWTAATAFDALVDYPPDARSLLAPHVPSFEFVLDDLSRSSERSLRSRSEDPLAALTLLLLKRAQEEQRALLETVRRFADLLTQIQDQGDRVLISRYILVVSNAKAREIRQALDASPEEPMKETLKTAAEWLQEEARVLERRRFLLKALGKFAPLSEATRAKIEAADGDRLEVWFDRALEAKTLDEVFTE